MDSRQIVIGSGPAGVSCAQALLAQGRRVLMLDGGARLEPENAAKLAQLSETPPATWKGNATAWMREGMQAAVEGIPLKLTYGSDYPFRAMPGAPLIVGEGINTKFSLGKGGLSTVWGTSVLPFRQHDMHGWPVTADDLAPHYSALLGFMPVAQASDALEEILPTYGPGVPMPLSAQATALLKTLESNASGLRKRGVLFGRSRLAINAAGVDAKGPCVRCGLCMYGCPYQLLYSTGHTVDRMIANPNFEYAPGHVVQRIEESLAGVRLHTTTNSGALQVIQGERAFVGAGVLATTALMLRSLDAYDQPVTLRESHYFLLPMLRLAAVPGFQRGDLHALAQLFIEIMDETITPDTIHLQTYTYNDLFEEPIAHKLGAASKVFPWQAFLSRLFLFQGFMHSDVSPTTAAHLERSGTSDVLKLAATLKPETKVILNKLVAKLTRLFPQTGLLPLLPLMREGEPGRGFHTGSSFPMSAEPTGFESDLLGRPAGLSRIHVVDSSVLPSIPATTITFTVMANAHRIGTLVGGGEV